MKTYLVEVPATSTWDSRRFDTEAAAVEYAKKTGGDVYHEEELKQDGVTFVKRTWIKIS